MTHQFVHATWANRKCVSGHVLNRYTEYMYVIPLKEIDQLSEYVDM